MGLDMYAYKVRADLVGDQQVDIDTTGAVLKAIGFQDLTEEQYQSLSEGKKKHYFEERNAAYQKAKLEGFIDTDFAYWRKFNALHGWMESLYRRKGGVSKDFNCDTVRLTLENLDELFADASNKRLAPTAGFFFGVQEPFSDDDKQEVIDFVWKARRAISEGYVVVYSSWW